MLSEPGIMHRFRCARRLLRVDLSGLGSSIVFQARGDPSPVSHRLPMVDPIMPVSLTALTGAAG
jgi:hypothetical protein